MKQQLKTERAAAAKLFKGAFGAPPAPVPGGGASAVYGRGDSGPSAAAAAGGRGPGGGAGGVAGYLGTLLWGLIAWLVGRLMRLVGLQAGRERILQRQEREGAGGQ